jgi:hypothetical protein
VADSAAPLLALGAGALLIGVLLGRSSEGEPAPARKPMDDEPTPKPPEPTIAVGEPDPNGPAPAPPAPPTAPPAQRRDDEKDDETALARMLRSEDPEFGVQVVIGWVTVQRARRLGMTVFKLLTGRPAKYGPQTLDGVSRYASTAEAPTPADRALARDLLGDRIRPSKAIREHGISPWVEWFPPRVTKTERAKLTAPEVAQLLRVREDQNAVNVLREQKPFGARGQFGDFGGIWGRIARSRWFLYDKRSPIVEYQSRIGGPTAALNAIQSVEPLDESSRRGQVA